MISAILHILFSERVAKAMLNDFDEGGGEAFISGCIVLMVLMTYIGLLAKIFVVIRGLL